LPDSQEKRTTNPFADTVVMPPPKKKRTSIDMDAIQRAEDASGYVPPERKKEKQLKKDKPAQAKAKLAPKKTALQKRREKNPKPETERYTARLEPETILYFVDYAEEHHLPMREVFKLAAQALKKTHS